MYRKGADYSFKEPKEPLSAPVLSPADTRSCIVIVVVVVVVVVILLLSRDLGSRQPLPYSLLFSPPRFFSNEFTRPSSFSRSFFPFLPKARATSASKHDDRPMMDRRIVDSPPPLPCTGTLVKSRLSPTQLLFRDRARDTPFHRP